MDCSGRCTGQMGGTTKDMSPLGQIVAEQPAAPGQADLAWLTAGQAAAALQAGVVRSIDLVEALLARIEQHNPSLNAIITLGAAQARRQAQAADKAYRQGQPVGPLHGIPITIKDSFETAGLSTVSGYPPLGGHVPSSDAPPVACLRQAGAILLGKTNLPSLADGIQTGNPVFGRTNNPWDLARTPGGSSGGAAGPLAFLAKTLALLGAMTLLRVLLSRMRIDQTIGPWWRGGGLRRWRSCCA